MPGSEGSPCGAMPASGTQNTAPCGAMAEQALLVPGDVWRGAGFAFRIGWQNPGEQSLKLGTPGLKYGRPLAFKTRLSVYRASLYSHPIDGSIQGTLFGNAFSKIAVASRRWVLGLVSEDHRQDAHGVEDGVKEHRHQEAAGDFVGEAEEDLSLIHI